VISPFCRYSSGKPLSITARTFSIRHSREPKSFGSIGGALVSGAPGVDHRAWLKYSAILPRLPQIARAVRAKKK
jgi:hypothetical protein